MTIPRFRKRRDFLRIAGTGFRWVAPTIIIQGAPLLPDHSSGRIGFTASKKVGNAVLRNRAKRRMREALRLSTPTPLSKDFVMVARAKATVSCPWPELLNDVKLALSRLTNKIP